MDQLDLQTYSSSEIKPETDELVVQSSNAFQLNENHLYPLDSRLVFSSEKKSPHEAIFRME